MALIFNARYHEYPIEITNEFNKWFQNGTHVDVTIHAGGQSVRAHKLVLAANSPFFNGIFLGAETASPHLHFADVPFQSMKSLIEYMYSGNLVVEREFLPACLQLADSLRVKGISGVSMDDILTEPAPVSASMHNLIDSLMKKYAPQKQKIQHQTPRKHLTRNQRKKLKRRCRKMLGRIGEPQEKVPSHEPSKLVFKRIKNTNGYMLEQFCNSKTDEKITATEENISKMDSRQQKYSSKTNNSNPEMQPQSTRQEDRSIGIENEMEEDSFFSEDMHCEHKNEEFETNMNAPMAPAYTKQEYIEKIHESQFKPNNTEHNNARFQNEVLNRKVSQMVAKKEERNFSEKLQPTAKDYIAKSSNVPKKNMGLHEKVRDEHETGAEKIETKIKKRKSSLQPSTKNKLDQEFEKLFGDNYLGIDNKDKINNNLQCSQAFFNKNEQTYLKPLVSALAQVDKPEEEKVESKNKNRRKVPVCPPPEDILKNGKPSFSCGLCKRIYTHKSNYRRHYMVFHKRCAEAVFQCPMCKKKFTRSDNRTHHIRRIHGYTNTASLLSEEQALYLCPICDKAFTRSYNRSFHLVEEHGIMSHLTLEK